MGGLGEGFGRVWEAFRLFGRLSSLICIFFVVFALFSCFFGCFEFVACLVALVAFHIFWLGAACSNNCSISSVLGLHACTTLTCDRSSRSMLRQVFLCSAVNG